MLNKNTIPWEEGMDKTLSLMREEYMYISNRCHSFQSDIFETRLFGKKAICMRGKEVAELFTIMTNLKEKGQYQSGSCNHFLAKIVFRRWMRRLINIGRTC